MKDNRSLADPGRRDFLTTGVRWTVAGVLLGGTIWCVRHGDDGSCQKVSPCSACPVLQEGCELPKAEAWRHTRQEGSVDA